MIDHMICGSSVKNLRFGLYLFMIKAVQRCVQKLANRVRSGRVVSGNVAIVFVAACLGLDGFFLGCLSYIKKTSTHDIEPYLETFFHHYRMIGLLFLLFLLH